MALCGFYICIIYERIAQECPSLVFVTGMWHRYKDYILIKDDVVVSPRFF